MASMKELNKHLQSVKTVGQVSGALRSTSTAKFSMVNKKLEALGEYTGELRKVMAMLPPMTPEEQREKGSSLVVLISSTRGLCGAYNDLLFDYAKENLILMDGFDLICCNKPAIRFVEKEGLRTLENYVFSDSPEYAEVQPMIHFLLTRFKRRRYKNLLFIEQKYVNALVQQPAILQILPFESAPETQVISDVLYHPDLQQIHDEAYDLLASAAIYEAVLKAGLSANAATMMSMKSAYDNAEEVASRLHLEISRKRQSAVTSSVIEIASGRNAEE